MPPEVQPESDSSSSLEFSLVRGGPFYRLRRRLGLAGGEDLNLLKRCAALIALTWLPVAAGAIIEGRAFEGGSADDPLLRHFGVHARLLLSIPLLLLGEAMMERIVPGLVRYFALSGLVSDPDVPLFAGILRRVERFRDSLWGALLVGLVVAATVATSAIDHFSGHELAWAGEGNLRGFPGAWYALVSRPVFAGLLALWGWRLAAGAWMLRLISKLDLHLVATHPDRTGGLGFLEKIAPASAPIVMAVSVVIAGRWGHDVLYHGVHVNSLKPLVATLVVSILVLFAGPMLQFSGILRGFKRRSLLEYGKVAGNQGRLVHRKWVAGQDVGDQPVLSAPELGPVADVITMYDAVARMRSTPIGARFVITIAAAALIPVLPVFAIEVPIKQLLKSLASALL